MLKIPTIFFLITLSVLAAIHFLALNFYLYWKFWWFDIVAHGLGGAAIALGIYTLYDLRVPLPDRLLNLVPVICGVLIVALCWEVFEIYAGVPIEDNYLFDTSIDTVMAIIGGVIGFFVGKALRTL